MRQWFALPQRDDEYETFAARVLHYTLLLLLAFLLIFLIFASSIAQLIFIPILMTLFGGCYILLHRGRLRLASMIFLSGLWTIITLASFSLNGIRNASVSGYAIVIIFSAVLISGRAVVIFTTMSVLSAITLTVGELWGLLPLRTTQLFIADRFFQHISLFGTAGILLFVASRVIRRSFERIRTDEKMLLERNQALEKEIAERQRTEAKYRLLFENISVMAGVYGRDGEIVLLNNTAASMLGGTPESLQGRNLRDVFTPEDADNAISSQIEAIQTGKDLLSEGKTSLPGGREIYYLRHVMPLPESNEGPQVLVLTTDLTEKLLSEQRERELALATEKNAFFADFFSTLSHDLKTPLTVMNSSLYLLKYAQTPEQREERIARIGEQIALMDKYIQDMLTISRLEHLPSLDFQSVNLNELVSQVVDLLRPRMDGKQLQFRFEPQPDLPSLRGDSEQLRRMLMNLVENAVNYTTLGGSVRVRTQANGVSLLLEVSDSGIGIEPEAVPRIFERFYRAASATVIERSGTGLGLAIVKKIAETHAAAIEVDSQPGKGTTFRISFPIEC